MGDVRRIHSAGRLDPGETLERERLCVDLSENVHLHYRDLRLEFTVVEWKQFFALLQRANRKIESEVKNGYEEGDDKYHKQWKTTINKSPAYWRGRVLVEEQENRKYHLHYNNMRLEFSPEQWEKFRTTVSSARMTRLTDLQVTVLPKSKAEFTPHMLVESPFYEALTTGNPHIYNVYRTRVLKERGGHCTPFEDYKQMVGEFKNGGFRATPIKLEKKNILIRDGHHRAAALLYCFGDVPVYILGQYAYPVLPASSIYLDGDYEERGNPARTRYPQSVYSPGLDANTEKVRDTEWKDEEKVWSDYLGKAQLSSSECHLLYDTTRRLGSGNYANVGTYRGASAYCLATGLKYNGHRGKVYSVDLFDEINGALHIAEFEELIKEKGLQAWVKPIQGWSHKVAETLAKEGVKFKAIFIDADHHYESVLRDFVSWSPLLEEGGELIFHDSNLFSVHMAIEGAKLNGWKEIRHTFTTKILK